MDFLPKAWGWRGGQERAFGGDGERGGSASGRYAGGGVKLG